MQCLHRCGAGTSVTKSLLLAVVVLTACSAGSEPELELDSLLPGPVASDGIAATSECADVIDAVVTQTSPGAFSVSATVRSADTGWDKYADKWTVEGGDEILGERVLTHPHETEQPFTRSLSDVGIPADVTEVVIAAHDSVNGFCGDTFSVPVPR